VKEEGAERKLRRGEEGPVLPSALLEMTVVGAGAAKIGDVVMMLPLALAFTAFTCGAFGSGVGGF